MFVNILWIIEKAPYQKAFSVAIKWGGTIKIFCKNSKQPALLELFCWLPIEGINTKISFETVSLVVNVPSKIAYGNALLSYISRLKSRRKLPPGKERNGLRLGAWRCDVEWVFSQTIDACRASVTLSKHCLCHYNGAWLAFVSFTLSKHWDLVPNCCLLAVVSL